jgi:hypothetical protein
MSADSCHIYVARMRVDGAMCDDGDYEMMRWRCARLKQDRATKLIYVQVNEPTAVV